jgi:hypothetical protein
LGVGHGAAVAGAEHVPLLGNFEQWILVPTLAAVSVLSPPAYLLAALLGVLGIFAPLLA